MNISKENNVMLYPGYTQDNADKSVREYPPLPIGSTLLVGCTGSGKTIVAENMLSSLIAQYGKEQVSLSIWDGKAVEFVRSGGNTTIADIDICDGLYNFFYMTLQEMLEKIAEEIKDRVMSFKSSGCRNYEEYISGGAYKLPRRIFFLEEAGGVIEGIFPSIEDDLQYILRMGDLAGVHTIISSQPNEVILEFTGFKYIWVTRVHDKESNTIFGEQAESIEYDKHGTIYVKDCQFNTVDKYNVPFYDDGKMRDIVNGTVCPNGFVIDADKRNELGKFVNRYYEK